MIKVDTINLVEEDYS